MGLDRRSLLGAAAALAAGSPLRAQTPPPGAGLVPLADQADPGETIDLWPQGAPGAPATPPMERVQKRSADPRIGDRAVTGISRPRMAVFRPARANGAAVLVTPGGGYARIVIDKEGYELGRWLSARGYTVFVLFYRLPGEGWAAGPNVALADAQRAMRIIRRRAGNFGIDPERVAALGFSAGGHLCADLATRFAAGVYDAVDEADALSARPALAAPIYPVISMTAPAAHAGSRTLLIGKDAGARLERAHAPHLNVPEDAPPTFLVHAEDDKVVPVENSLLFRAALKARGIPVETHLFAEGGHGFGVRGAIGKPAEAWPELFLAWARRQGLG